MSVIDRLREEFTVGPAPARAQTEAAAQRSDAAAMARMSARIIERSSPQPNGCRLWLGSLNSAGYGKLKVGNASVLAHRASWYVTHGRWPEPWLVVMHSCDTPACVESTHLTLATPADNLRDARVKGRHVAPRRKVGDLCRNGLHVLTSEESGPNGSRCAPCYEAKMARKQARRRVA